MGVAAGVAGARAKAKVARMAEAREAAAAIRPKASGAGHRFPWPAWAGREQAGRVEKPMQAIENTWQPKKPPSWGANPVFHEISRAAGPKKQTTKCDRLPHGGV